MFMKYTFPVFLFLLLSPFCLFSQTTLPGTCSIPLPTGWTINSTTGALTVPLITTGGITVTGGKTYAAGNYIVNISATGVVTFTAYTPSTTTTTSQGYVIQVPALNAWAVYKGTVTVPGAVLPVVPAGSTTGTPITGSVAVASPIGGLANGYQYYSASVTATNQVTLVIDNQFDGPAVPAQAWIVKVQ
jgi:hypothetical protein